MIETKFIVSECGNSADEAWGRAQAIASLENFNKTKPHGGILDKDGFKIVGKMKPGADAFNAAQEMVKAHKESTPEAEKALCIDAGEGEYYFFGRSCKE